MPPSTPPRIVDLLKRCLKKDPRERLRDIGDARIEIDDARHSAASPSATESPAIATARPLRPLITIAVAAAAGGAALALAIAWRGTRGERPRAPSAPLTRTSIELPANAQLALGTQIPLEGFDSPVVTLSPDGRRLVYVGQSPSGTMLYQRELAAATTAPIAGPEGAIYAFFSPDSRWIGFLTNTKLKKTSVEGGAPATLCDTFSPLSASWLRDDTIFLLEDEGARLSRVPAAGGRPEVALRMRANKRTLFSQTLPDGRAALGTAQIQGISADYADVVVTSIADGTTKTVLHSGYDARYVEPGYLLFGRSGNVFAVRFNPDTRQAAGEPVLIAAGVGMESLFAQVHFTASANGLLAFASGRDRAIGRLAWVDRRGGTEFLPAPSAIYGALDLSADGNRIAVHVGDVTDYIFVYDVKRAEGRKLVASDHAGWPVWSPDGTTIAFSTWRSSGESAIAVRSADGGDIREIVPRTTGTQIDPSHWSPDGRALAANVLADGMSTRVFAVGAAGAADDRPFVSVPNGSGLAYFSPDGRWVAFVGGTAGPEVFVQSFPDGKTTRQISVDGGIEPLWCRCGELFYRKGNQWMSVRIRTTPELTWDPPQAAFQTDFIDTPGRSYAVSPDGARLLVVKAAAADVRNRINLVTNWTEALRQ